MKRHVAVAVLLSVFLVAALVPAFALDLEVTYVEGRLQARQGNSWKDLEIGDKVADTATVQFDGVGVAELAGPGARVTIKQKGQYLLSDIVAKSREVASSGLGSMIKGRVASVIQGSQKTGSAVMGVRAAEAGSEKEKVSWLGSASDLVSQARKSMEAGSYEQALKSLEEAYDYADASEEPTILYYTAVANVMLERNAPALKALAEAKMQPAESLYGDYLMLYGWLLVDALSFRDAYGAFDSYRSTLPAGQSVQAANLWAGYCAKELGNTAEARRSLEAARKADPASELGRKADELLGKL